MLCNCRLNPRRLAVHILREAKTLLRTLAPTDEEPSVIDVIDRSCVQVVNDKCLHMLPPAEKAAVLSMSNIDLQWLADRNNCVWTAGSSHHLSSLYPFSNILPHFPFSNPNENLLISCRSIHLNFKTPLEHHIFFF